MIVAATLAGASATNSAACFVVICSSTILSSGKSRTSGDRMRSMNTASRSNTSTSGSVTSPWMQQHHADLLHALQRRIDGADVGHAAGAVGGRAGRIELGRDPHALGISACKLVRIDIVGQITGHQRSEARARSRDDPVAIGGSGLDAGHRRHEIGHDDRPRELPRGIRRDLRQHLAVAQMDMPVVGPADGRAIAKSRRLLS